MNNTAQRSTYVRKAVRIVLVVVLALIALLAVAGYVASRVVESRVTALLGGLGHAQSIHTGMREIVLENVEIGAPPGWPAPQTLRAARVVLEPEWRALLSNRVSIKRVTVDDYYLSALRTKDGKLRILPTLEDRVESQETDTGGTPGSKRPTNIDLVVLNGGSMDFFDASIATPPHRIPIANVQAQIGPLHAPATDAHTAIQLTARMGTPAAGGDLRVDGWTAQASHDADMHTTLRGAPIQLVAPYLQKHAPATLAGGQMDLDMQTRVAQQRLDAHGRVTLHDLRFDNSGGALLSLPRKAVVAALENRHGTVTFDFTLQGNLRDPKFSLNDNIAARLTGGFANAIGVSAEGVAGGVGEAVKNLGGALNDLLK